MRTTVNLDPDVAAAVAELRRQHTLGLSQAINQLVRKGLRAQPASARFHQRTAHLGLRLDVTQVPGALELLEARPSGASTRWAPSTHQSRHRDPPSRW